MSDRCDRAQERLEKKEEDFEYGDATRRQVRRAQEQADRACGRGRHDRGNDSTIILRDGTRIIIDQYGRFGLGEERFSDRGSLLRRFPEHMQDDVEELIEQELQLRQDRLDAIEQERYERDIAPTGTIPAPVPIPGPAPYAGPVPDINVGTPSTGVTGGQEVAAPDQPLCLPGDAACIEQRNSQRR